MINKTMNPFEHCPSFRTENYIFRQTSLEDACDLFECYSDKEAVRFFNSDNCHTDFYFQTLKDMKAYMQIWEQEYQDKVYVRFSILAKDSNKAIGTIEFCPWNKKTEGYGKLAVLRIDLASSYEKEGVITEVLKAVEDNLYDLFQVEQVFTKAVPEATARMQALLNCGYQKVAEGTIVPFGDYYIR
ncbi:GNAT family protein [Anaerocolumna sp. AGMB13025]|uniref:GNAT family N-acetyltransferase n=1 Tax=Anaerocolumna sp. AGMB13025 TaxID=3039116 RepID=UPI00241C919F|nr:GNAT family protein [Anaerocolumna sp. AGMB13025]WFR54882.1 GNAT family protein [Anaerocolumna sp. AGMB13025]